MLYKENRLRLKKDFEKVFKNGKGFHQDFLFLKLLGNDKKQTRVGFVVSKKISNKAVIRNKVKRRLREIIRDQITEINQGFDIVLVALPGLEEKDFSEIKNMVNNLLNKAGII
ncbi:MAG: ribonuclease P protein component [Candidatus Pacebacteria bacterium]|nr:ribonuclease P protein component [Candidatus Paceibacterota bacterium]